MRRCVIALALAVAPAAQAQEPGVLDTLHQSFEMPAHRSLMSVIGDPNADLAPFVTDGCSGGMSWSWRVVADVFPDFKAAQGTAPPWEECCVIHDRAYHNADGATDAQDSFAARLAADTALRDCVADPGAAAIDDLVARYDATADQIRFAYDLVATSMFNAVRFGGGPCSGLPWRWGFGYPGCVPGL